MIFGIGLLLALLTPGCANGSPTAPGKVRLGQTFDLRPGQAAVVTPDGLRLSFREVSEDSRCPVDADCIWMGDAAVMLEAETEPEHKQTVTLHTNGSIAGGSSATLLGHVIELKGLQPGNKAGVTPDPKDYVATLLVSRPPK